MNSKKMNQGERSMDLRALKTFQTVVKVGSFQQAAQELQYVQSTVTMQIKKLEADLGVTLFHRGKNLTLTEAGRLLLGHASPLLHNVEIVEQAMREVSIGEAGFVRVGCIEPTASRRFSQLVREFCATRPHVSMSFEVMSTKMLTERVLAGELDFAICSLPDIPGEYEFEPIFTESLSLILSMAHPLAEKEFVRWSDLTEERILYASLNCQYRCRLDNCLLQLKQTLPSTMQVAGSYEVMMQFVQHGMGLAFAPSIYAGTAPDHLVSREIEDVSLDLPIGLLRRREAIPLGNAASAFYLHIRSHLHS
jgi:LysR family transcriptional regulator, regulator of the ytmI operon